jgi:hypothetical protein
MKSIRNLIAAIALIAITVSVSAQAFVTPTASFTPVATGNSVWVTKSDAGKPTGSIYSRGYSKDFSTLIEFYLPFGAPVVFWRWEGDYLYMTSYENGFASAAAMYLCRPKSDGRIALQVITKIGASTVAAQGALRASLGYSIIVDPGSQASGFLDFPASTIQQVQFRVVAY